MHSVTFEYAQAHLAELLAEVAAGQDIVIKRDNQPLARLVAEPVLSGADPKTHAAASDWPFMGLYAGTVLPDGWDADLPLEMWDAINS